MATNARTSKSIKIESRTLGASLTDEPISAQFPVSDTGSKNLLIDVKVSGVTVGGGITLKLEDTSNGFEHSEVKSKTTSVTADGTFTLSFMAEKAADQADLPLRNDARLVMDTGAGSAVTIDEIRIIQGS